MSQTFIISSHHALKAGHHMDLYLSTTEDCTDFLAYALPKGFPTEKGVKHLAIKVENHSSEAAHFEGTIPEGQYGAGTKEVWDEGTYIPYRHIIAPKPVRIDFFGSKIVGSYYLKQWQGSRWLIFKVREGEHDNITRASRKGGNVSNTRGTIARDENKS